MCYYERLGYVVDTLSTWLSVREEFFLACIQAEFVIIWRKLNRDFNRTRIACAFSTVQKKAFDLRKRQDRVITNTLVTDLLSRIKENILSACVLYSIEHGRGDGLPSTLISKAVEFAM